MDLFLYNLPHWGAFFYLPFHKFILQWMQWRETWDWYLAQRYLTCRLEQKKIKLPTFWFTRWPALRPEPQPKDHYNWVSIHKYFTANFKKKRKEKKKTCMGKWGAVVRCLHCTGNIYSKVNFLFWLIHCRLI